MIGNCRALTEIFAAQNPLADVEGLGKQERAKTHEVRTYNIYQVYNRRLYYILNGAI